MANNQHNTDLAVDDVIRLLNAQHNFALGQHNLSWCEVNNPRVTVSAESSAPQSTEGQPRNQY